MKLISQEEMDVLRKAPNQSQSTSGRKISGDDDDDDTENNQNSRAQDDKGNSHVAIAFI